MAQQLIDIGVAEDTQTGDPGRTVCIKVNENTTELYAIKAQVQFTAITTATRVITDDELVLGKNIFGVNYGGAVSVILPAGIDSNKIIIINDESGLAGTNNIIISVGEDANTLFPPTGFAIDSVTDTTMTVIWEPPAQGSAVGYLVYANGTPIVNTGWSIGDSVVVPGLTPNTSYTMYIVTYDVEGNESSPSNEATATTDP